MARLPPPGQFLALRPGSAVTPYPAFFAYGYPWPAGVERAAVRPDAARWDEASGLFLLAYDAARTADDPEGAIMEFRGSTYDACAAGPGWSPELVSETTRRS